MTWRNEAEAREAIKQLVAQYYHDFHENEHPYRKGGRIAYGGRVYDERELCALTDATLDFWLTTGRFCEQFERDFGAFLGVKHVHLVNSGSSANLLAFMTLTSHLLGERRILPGDEVITVACGFPTTIGPILQYGAVPVFVDVTLPQYNVDVSQLADALSPRTKAVMLAHTLGNPFDIAAVRSFCDKNGLWLIEDNCDALGSEYTIGGETRRTGAWGDIGTSSFYPPHHMTMGEGGAVYTNDIKLSRIALSLRDWGRACVCPSGRDNFCGHRYDGQFGDLPKGYDHKYVYDHIGYNLKATDMQAAVGCAQLEKLPGFIERRRHNWARLRAALAPAGDRFLLPEAAPGSNPSWFGFLLTCRGDLSRNALVQRIEAAGVQTRMLFSGNILRQPCMSETGVQNYRVAGSLENSDRIVRDTFWVGVYPGMTDAMVDDMAEIILRESERP
jgi:dTDP-4-amino-4,6-dideoxygalactose transaminase